MDRMAAALLMIAGAVLIVAGIDPPGWTNHRMASWTMRILGAIMFAVGLVGAFAWGF